MNYFKIETDKIKRPLTPHQELRQYQELLRVAYENLYRLNVSESAPIMKAIRSKVEVAEMQPTAIDWQPTEENKLKWLKTIEI